MTADDVIAANPSVAFVKAECPSGFNGHALIAETSPRQFVLVKGEKACWVHAPWTDADIRLAVQQVNYSQPGKEFATVWDDMYAAKLREKGIEVHRDAKGCVRVGLTS